MDVDVFVCPTVINLSVLSLYLNCIVIDKYALI